MFRVPLPTKDNCANADAFIKHVLAPACKAGAVSIKGEKPGGITIKVEGSTQSYVLADGRNWAETIGVWINATVVKEKRTDPLKSKDELKNGMWVEIRKP